MQQTEIPCSGRVLYLNVAQKCCHSLSYIKLVDFMSHRQRCNRQESPRSGHRMSHRQTCNKAKYPPSSRIVSLNVAQRCCHSLDTIKSSHKQRCNRQKGLSLRRMIRLECCHSLDAIKVSHRQTCNRVEYNLSGHMVSLGVA